MKFANGSHHLVAVGIQVIMDFESELLEGGLHEPGIIDRVLEIILSDVVGVADDECDPLLG